jgi:hypothetical protein
MRPRPVLAILLCMVTPGYSQGSPAIERPLFFGDLEIAGAHISPDENQITFLKPFDGVRNTWVKAVD